MKLDGENEEELILALAKLIKEQYIYQDRIDKCKMLMSRNKAKKWDAVKRIKVERRLASAIKKLELINEKIAEVKNKLT